MSKYEVAKPFNTVNRRMTLGAPVDETDNLEPFSVIERLETGYLRLKAVPLVAQAVAPARPPRMRTDVADEIK